MLNTLNRFSFRRGLCGLLVLVLLCARSVAADPLDLPPGADARLMAALDANYRMEFGAAAQELAALEPIAPDHPIVAFGGLLTEWWKLTAAVWEEDAEKSAPMLAAAETCLAAAERRIEAGDPTGEGHLVKGATLGLLGRWHIKNRHWMKSYFIGKDAKAALQEALAINPQLHDAHAGIGIYDYFVAKLPGVVRWLAFSGQTSDPADGLRELDLALAQGRYTVVGARAALALIQIRNEKNPARALEICDELIAAHPQSPFFGALRMIALHDLNRGDALAAEADRQAVLLRTGAYPATRGAQVWFAAGLAKFRQQDWAGARRDYMRAVEVGDPSDPFATWARLHLGNIHDALGEREAARTVYREVRGMTNRWGTRRLAERYRDEAFDPATDLAQLLPD